jgi:predicted acylesterase/phospholipase RssA
LVSVFIFLAWCMISIKDVLERPSVATVAAYNPPRPRTHRTRIGLCLSGGGYRAALFHAGVLQELSQANIDIDAMSSVSGGSIIASFVARGGHPTDFLELLCSGTFNLKREAVNVFTIARFLGSSSYTRTDVQADMFDRVFLSKAELMEFTTRPDLMLCTTDIGSGELVGILSNGAITLRIESAIRRTAFMTAGVGYGEPAKPEFADSDSCGIPDHLRIAQLVAASGAFPGALRPLVVPTADHTYVLADGGIGDNLGISLALSAVELAKFSKQSRDSEEADRSPAQDRAASWHLEKWELDLLIVSDGSAIRVSSLPKSELGMIGDAIDTMYLATGGSQIVGQYEPSIAPPEALLLSPRVLYNGVVTNGTDDETSRTLLFFGTELVLAPDMISFAKIEYNTLEFIIDNMPVEDRRRARECLTSCAASGAYRGGGWHNAAWTLGDAPRTLFELVKQEIDRCMRAFLGTSTLDDEIDPNTARLVFRLGQYLARLNLPQIRAHLK